MCCLKQILPSMQINIGLVGLGHISKSHIKAIHATPFLNLIAGADPQVRADDFKSYADYRDILCDPSISAVGIATPPHTHFAIAEDALNANKHVLIEKPPVFTLSEAQQLIRLADRNNLTLFFAYHMKYNEAVKSAKDELINKDIQEINVVFNEHVYHHHKSDSWVFNKKFAGGGALMDSGINIFSILTELLSEDLKVNKEVIHFKEDINVEVGADLEFTAGDTYGSIVLNWCADNNLRRQITIYSQNNNYLIDINNGKFYKNTQLIDNRKYKHEYEELYAHFADCISKKISYTPLKEIMYVLDIYSKRK